ncbi:hypothetical protein [Longimicrobium terrae]|uniref:asparagine synthase (glutamine-hydrolyzing) n=1 Tax=Longimicrobium terrae TaxID=1639882 RepID=A0A841GU79_9BACT|nr:hypothetical protein [Longimicrobium terrae]MBB4634647.1 hypothetical protein [Longimicrobium terrae]MBB6068463.1 hypothetical protein [Longimicrobium terrae]NNC27656.1 hypothetical protein [Longimicrobium terrae]
MTDFLFASPAPAPGALRTVLEAYLGAVATVTELRGNWGALAVATPWPGRDAVIERDGWITVLAGEPVVRAPGMAPGVVAPGPLRDSVHQLLSADPKPDWGARLDGQFAAIGIDTRTGGGMIVTDRMSFIPVFAATDELGARVMGTHADAVATASGRTEVDPVSAADLLTTRCIAFPHTLFHGVTQMPPGTARRFGPGTAVNSVADKDETYWQPVERTAFANVREASEALREALLAEVAIACAGLEHVGLLLSAGEDSRAVLGAVPAGVRVSAFIYADADNREVQVARMAANAYGATLTWGRRPREHYLGAMETVSAMVGSHQVWVDVHGYGFHTSLGLASLPRVLGGYSSDSLLKAEHARKTAIRLRPVAGIRPELLEQVRIRHQAHVDRVTAIRPGSGGEWYRLWPFSMRSTGANVHGNRRLFHIYEPFHSAAVLDIAAGVPQGWKRDRGLFHPAIRPLLRRSWNVPHARSRFPYFGRTANLLLGAGLRATRAINGLRSGGKGMNQGPWPRWSEPEYAAPMADLEARHNLPRSALGGVLAVEGDAAQATVRAWDPMERFIAMQLAYLSERAADVAREARAP